MNDPSPLPRIFRIFHITSYYHSDNLEYLILAIFLIVGTSCPLVVIPKDNFAIFPFVYHVIKSYQR